MSPRDPHRRRHHHGPLAPQHHNAVAAVAALVLVLVLGACGPDDGRQLADPDPALTAVPVPTTAAPVIDASVPLQGIGPGELTLSSPDFRPGALLPADAICAGALSPGLRWTDPPARTTELALVAQDIDAEGVALWVVTGIDPDENQARRGRAPRGGDVRQNSSGVDAWTGPCPTDFSHRIVFTLYLLDQPLPAGAGDATSVISAVQQASFGSASLIGRVDPGGAGATNEPTDTEPG